MPFLNLWCSPLTVSSLLYPEVINHNFWSGARARVFFDDPKVIAMGSHVEKLSLENTWSKSRNNNSVRLRGAAGRKASRIFQAVSHLCKVMMRWSAFSPLFRYGHTISESWKTLSKLTQLLSSDIKTGTSAWLHTKPFKERTVRPRCSAESSQDGLGIIWSWPSELCCCLGW